ncbi:MAG: FHA domain-containing protein [Planctomycetaceae bacterium]|nr:FHA domain-containing protein [Planctomycetaceae bacterium]
MTELRKPAALITFKDLQGREVRVPLFPPKMTVGKMTDNDLCLSRDPAVSRRHCEVRVQGSDLVLYDLGSSNGTYVNGQRLHPREIRILRNGDQLRLGKLVILVSYHHPGEELMLG